MSRRTRNRHSHHHPASPSRRDALPTAGTPFAPFTQKRMSLQLRHPSAKATQGPLTHRTRGLPIRVEQVRPIRPTQMGTHDLPIHLSRQPVRDSPAAEAARGIHLHVGHPCACQGRMQPSRVPVPRQRLLHRHTSHEAHKHPFPRQAAHTVAKRHRPRHPAQPVEEPRRVEKRDAPPWIRDDRRSARATPLPLVQEIHKRRWIQD